MPVLATLFVFNNCGDFQFLSDCRTDNLRDFNGPFRENFRLTIHHPADIFQLMTRLQLLAAEIFSYSFGNYADHLGIGHERFEELMPQAAMNLERAEKEGWMDGRLAQALDVDVKDVPAWRKRFRDAVEVVDARNPAEGFRNAVRQSLVFEFTQGPAGDAKIESAVKQICYRTADLGFLLKRNGTKLEDYSADLRREDEDHEDGESPAP
jgi:hypothetical protein